MLSDVMTAAKRFMSKELGLQASIVSVEPAGEGWMARAEVVIDDPQMRLLARKDVIASYEIRLNAEYVVQSFERKAMRERGSIGP